LVWQRNYYDHVIRGASSLSGIREDIRRNPAPWAEDPENPNIGISGRFAYNVAPLAPRLGDKR